MTSAGGRRGGTLALASLAALLTAGAPPPAASLVAYQLTPEMRGEALAALSVRIRFKGDADGETRLLLPSKWAGKDELWRQVADLSVEGAEVGSDGPAARVLRHRPSAPLVVRYRIVPAHAADPAADYEKAQPIVRPDWLFAHGEGLFAVPEGREAARASFAWGQIPKTWTLATDLEHLSRARPGKVEDVLESVLIGAPDLTVIRREIGGAPVRIAIRGRWGFAPEAFADLALRIVAAENAFWGDRGRPFLLAVAPLQTGGGRSSSNGTGRSDAFSIVATTDYDLLKEAHFLAHEYMHTWIARELGGQPTKDEVLEYWFSEGFTDFYASRVLLRSGVWSLEDFVAKQNEVLARYAASPAVNRPNDKIGEDFWGDPAVGQLPYDRGRLLATLWDDRLRRRTGGRLDLDDVLRAQRAEARANAGAGRVVSGGALFPAVYARVAGLDPAPEIARYLELGETVRLPPDLYGACARVETLMVPAFDRGFDGTRSAETGVITGVDLAGPAYAAGLRDGMKRLGREGGREGDSRVEIGYRVGLGDGSERVIRYLPEGKATTSIQQVVLSPNLSPERRSACARALSGAEAVQRKRRVRR
jgi:predicted metalloprotease with PDZ domain